MAELGLIFSLQGLAGLGLRPPHPQEPPRGQGALCSPLLIFSCLVPAFLSPAPVDPLRISPVLRAPLTEGIREIIDMAPKQ